MMSNAFVRAIVGPIGSGKSSGCIMEILRRAMMQQPASDGIRHTRFLVVRNTYRELEDTTRKTFENWIKPGMGKWKEKDFTFHLKFGDVHSEVLFRALDKPQDVSKLLSLELTGAYLNEFREISKEAFDLVQGRVGRYPSRSDGGPTWSGVWADTNPFAQTSGYYKLFKKDRPEGFELYEQPSGLSPDAENLDGLIVGYYSRLMRGKDREWIEEYIESKYPASDKGSVYGDYITALEEAGLVVDFVCPRDGVFAVFDLGVSDSTAIWWFRFGAGGGIDVIDWYENHGESATHYIEQLNNRGYSYSKIYLPHDARQRTFQTGISTLQQFRSEYGNLVDIVPDLGEDSTGVSDGIGAGRWILEQMPRFHKTKCAVGLERLKSYKYQWDTAKQVFSKTPLHDFSSHTADAFRYLALVAKRSGRIAERRVLPAAAPVARAIDKGFNLNELWDARMAIQSGKRNRI